MKKHTWLNDEEYASIFSQVPRMCVDVAIRNAQGLLLVYRTIEPYRNLWHLPGGGVRFGESLIAAVRRIAKQETGLTVKSGKFIGTMEFPHERKNGNRQHSISVVFEATSVTGKIHGEQSGERAEFFKTLPSRIIPIHKKFLLENNLA